ncbi:MAG: hypothetical protein ACTSV1_06450 [Alphaproteobacteria bacterium]
MRKLIGAGVVLLAVVLSGCQNTADVIIPSCPGASILDETSTLTRFKQGSGRDLIDIDFEAEIIGISGGCRFDIDDDTGTGNIEMSVRTTFKLTRGTANADARATLRYFVVLTDAASAVIDKQVFPYEAEFLNNRTVITDEDAPIKLNIPIRSGQTGEDFRVFVGFQLSRDELLYNRDR